MKFYRITANGVQTVRGWATQFQIPTFFLRADVQGIISAEHAERVARDILTASRPSCVFTITASVEE